MAIIDFFDRYHVTDVCAKFHLSTTKFNFILHFYLVLCRGRYRAHFQISYITTSGVEDLTNDSSLAQIGHSLCEL